MGTPSEDFRLDDNLELFPHGDFQKGRFKLQSPAPPPEYVSMEEFGRRWGEYFPECWALTRSLLEMADAAGDDEFLRRMLQADAECLVRMASDSAYHDHDGTRPNTDASTASEFEAEIREKLKGYGKLELMIASARERGDDELVVLLEEHKRYGLFDPHRWSELHPYFFG